MTAPADPLANIVFVRIPEKLYPILSEAVDKDMPIPYERASADPSPAALTLEAIIAGMLRVIIYRPEHEYASSYKTIVKRLRPAIKEEFTQAGQVKASQKDFPIAIEIFRALAGLFPDDPTCAFNLALVYHDASHHEKNDTRQAEEYIEEAFRAYRAALMRETVLPDLYVNYGYFLLEQENYEKALEHFREYLRQEKSDQKKAPIEKIVASLDQIRKQDELFKEAFDDISLGKEALGVEKATALLKSHPDFWNGWFLLGWGQRRLGLYLEAKSSFSRALELAPPKADLLNELAIVHMELGEFTDSYRHLTEARRLEPENTKIISNLGVVCFRLERLDEAAGFFKTVLELSPGDQIARGYLEKLAKKNN